MLRNAAGGVLVLVTGVIARPGKAEKKPFVQTFFLARASSTDGGSLRLSVFLGFILAWRAAPPMDVLPFVSTSPPPS